MRLWTTAFVPLNTPWARDTAIRQMTETVRRA